MGKLRCPLTHGEHNLPYEMFDKIRQVNQAAVVDNKHLDAALTMAKLIQEQLPARKRNNNEPSRRSQPHTLFPAPEPENGVVKRRRGRPPLSRARSIEAVLEPA